MTYRVTLRMESRSVLRWDFPTLEEAVRHIVEEQALYPGNELHDFALFRPAEEYDVEELVNKYKKENKT